MLLFVHSKKIKRDRWRESKKKERWKESRKKKRIIKSAQYFSFTFSTKHTLIMRKAKIKYSRDLNNENIWITNFYLSGSQMSGIQMVVRYLDHHLNNGQNLVWYSNDIRITDHSVIGQLSTIWIPDLSGIQIPTVFQ